MRQRSHWLPAILQVRSRLQAMNGSWLTSETVIPAPRGLRLSSQPVTWSICPRGGPRGQSSLPELPFKNS